MHTYLDEFNRWKEKADNATKAELAAMEGDETKIEFCFSAPLSFGTAGLRGQMMPGINAMNTYTVAQATQGLATYLLKDSGVSDAAQRGVLVGCDSRINSPLFAKITACVLAANGIKVYLYDALRPTPMVSFGLRELHCLAGVNITASHNPKEYNGYKVYYEDGAQISPEQAQKISAAIAATDLFEGVTTCDYEKAVEEGRITLLHEDFDEKYLTKVMEQQVDPTVVASVADSLKIVYTPFHGAGYRLVPEVLRRCGLKYLYPVEEQMVLDGSFPTVKSPNPENPEGFTLGIALAEKVQSDLIIGTDPDADRTGVMARNKEGKFETISGNRMGALLLEYILEAHTQNGTMPPEPYAIKTIVTTGLAGAICDHYGVKLYDVLTGFKYIGEIIKKSEEAGRGSFILGYEESYGYLKGSYARDKDAVVASMLICEMAAFYKKKGMTLCDAQEKMLEKYGYYTELTDNIFLQGLDGLAKMQALMDSIRKDPPKQFAGKAVLAVRDYKTGIITAKDGSTSPTGLPTSNVLYFDLEGGSSVIIRPSGTEPKIKIYLLVKENSKESAEAFLAALRTAIDPWRG